MVMSSELEAVTLSLMRPVISGGNEVLWFWKEPEMHLNLKMHLNLMTETGIFQKQPHKQRLKGISQNKIIKLKSVYFTIQTFFFSQSQAYLSQL